jgi:hypothetical protein
MGKVKKATARNKMIGNVFRIVDRNFIDRLLFLSASQAEFVIDINALTFALHLFPHPFER